MQVFSSGRSPLLQAAMLLLISSVPVLRIHAQAADDEKAYKAARAQTEPDARISSLQAYLSAFPSGAHAATAQDLLFQTYLANSPDRLSSIHTVAQQLVLSAPAGLERWIEESRVALQLSAAGPDGLDLPYARSLADDALSHLTEASYQHEVAAAQARYKLPHLPAKQVHAEYLEYKASFLAGAAAVEIKQHQLTPAASLLAEAYKLQPLSGQINALRGELALAQNDRAAALASLERADAMGALTPEGKSRELQLFHDLQHSDAAALEAQVDHVYRSLYPPPFTLPPRQLAAGGHTALLELFTGSGCQPCAGPDLAIDSLLGSYSRHDLVVLAWDEPIPKPDPLTNQDSMNRAATYGVGQTPLAFLDGQPLDVLGASRNDVENIVIGFADRMEEQASRPSGLQLNLDVTRDANSNLSARPALKLTPLPPSEAAVSTGDTTLRKLSQDVLYVALVQDNIRYSGENGIRLHRMVVRAVTQVSTTAYLSGTAPASIVFKPAELESTQRTFLDRYEKSNDSFGAFHFTTKDLPITGADLAIVAWVQDPNTHQVLQATYAAAPPR